MLGAEFVTVVPRFSSYGLDDNGMIGPASGAEFGSYDPFEDFTLGDTDRPKKSRPAYESFMRMSSANDALGWVSANGLLGIGKLPAEGPVVGHYRAVAGTFDPAYREDSSAIVAAARHMRTTADRLRTVGALEPGDDLSSVGDAWPGLAHVLDGTTYGRGVFLAPVLSLESLPPRWRARFTYGALIEALYAMLLFDLDGRVLRKCECGELFVARRTSMRAYCPPPRADGIEVCSNKFKKRRQRHPREG